MAEFRCPESSPHKAALFPTPQSRASVAVAVPGTLLRGAAEVCSEKLWLCIPLAKENPLRRQRGLQSCWVRVGRLRTGAPEHGLPQWAGATHAKSSGSLLDLQWERPFCQGEPVTYTVEMQPEGGEWQTVWERRLGEEFGSQRIEVTLSWPCCTGRALLRVVAASGPWLLCSVSRRVSGRTDAGEPGGGGRRGSLPALLTTSPGGNCSLSAQRSLTMSGALSDRAAMLQRAARYAPAASCSPTRKRIVLRRLGAAGPGEPLRKAIVMGLFHSCTTAMVSELQRRFDVHVINTDLRSTSRTADGFWKHRVHRRRPPEIDDDTLVILMVKEPYFWMKSMARCFYQLHPLAKGKDEVFRDVPSREMEDLFGHVEHDQVIYPNAVALWSDAVASYFDDSIYPPETSAVVRAEDFLFHFHEVMDELAIMGLPERSAGGESLAPLPDRTKESARSRDEALAFYGSRENRRSGFSVDQLFDVHEGVDEETADLLGYGRDAVESWLPAGQC